MNGTAWVQERRLPSGEMRYDVKYRRGGRGFQVLRAGAFKNRRDAKARAALISGYLARNMDPRVELARESASLKTIEELWPDWVATLRDVGEKRRGAIRDAWRHIQPVIGHLAPADVQVEHGLRLIEKMEQRLAPSTLNMYFIVAKQFMDAHDQPVLRSKLIRLPKVVQEEVNAMSFAEFMALRKEFAEPTKPQSGQVSQAPLLLLALDFIEATALRIGDAQKLLRGDVDFFEGKVRVSKARGKSAVSRWVPVPRMLLDELLKRPQEPGDLLLPELTKMDMKGHMRRACVRAGIQHFHPHDLRHRRASLWVYQGVPLPLVSQRVGHSDMATTMRVYAHVVSDSRDRWTATDYVGGVR